MNRLEIILLCVICGILFALAYRDFWVPRKQSRMRRDKRREARRIGKIRTLISSRLASLRKTQRLTDQRILDTRDENVD